MGIENNVEVSSCSRIAVKRAYKRARQHELDPDLFEMRAQHTKEIVWSGAESHDAYGLWGEEGAGGIHLGVEFVTPDDSEKRVVNLFFGVARVTMGDSLFANLVCRFGHLYGHSDFFFAS